jgi:peptidoglycan LD-endopeptidase CwlK
MNLSPISETRLGDVYPPLAEKIRELANLLEPEGINLVVVEGLRSWNEQDHLYAQGRTAGVPGQIVTNCPGGQSWHNFGLAVDCAPEIAALGPLAGIDWNAAHPQWKRMEAVGVSLGLVTGANWIRIKDAPHFQLTGRFAASPDEEVRQIFREGGMALVWEEAFGSI